MENLNVAHFLGIYEIRKQMQEKGITNPRPEIKLFTSKLVEKLSKMPLEEEIILEKNAFYDSKGNLIAKLPLTKKE